MKFLTGMKDGRVFLGVLSEQGKAVDLTGLKEKKYRRLPGSMQELIEGGEEALEAVREVLQGVDKNDEIYKYHLDEVKLLAPIQRPAKNIFCVGKNYAEHAIEMGSADDIPEHVMVFSKTPTTVIGTEEIILNHKEITNQLDYEGELAVIIGKKGRGIKKEQALDYVFGYTIVNDITARDLQSRHKQYLIGKSLDTSCPMGPYLVHKSAVENPNRLNIETRVNGEVRQSANTEQFIFDVETVISVLSQGMTLEPGDIIATGTPSGVGKGFKPPRFLQPGDEIQITVEGLGTLRNVIEK